MSSTIPKKLKKGFLRLFIVISIIAFFYGYISAAERLQSHHINGRIALREGIAELQSGKCEVFRSAKNRSAISFDNIDVNENCGNLKSVLGYLQLEGVDLSSLVLQNDFDKKYDYYVVKNGLIEASLFFISVWVCFVMLILSLKITMWVIDGFKDKSDTPLM